MWQSVIVRWILYTHINIVTSGQLGNDQVIITELEMNLRAIIGARDLFQRFMLVPLLVFIV